MEETEKDGYKKREKDWSKENVGKQQRERANPHIPLAKKKV